MSKTPAFRSAWASRSPERNSDGDRRVRSPFRALLRRRLLLQRILNRRLQRHRPSLRPRRCECLFAQDAAARSTERSCSARSAVHGGQPRFAQRLRCSQEATARSGCACAPATAANPSRFCAMPRLPPSSRQIARLSLKSPVRCSQISPRTWAASPRSLSDREMPRLSPQLTGGVHQALLQERPRCPRTLLDRGPLSPGGRATRRCRSCPLAHGRLPRSPPGAPALPRTLFDRGPLFLGRGQLGDASFVPELPADRQALLEAHSRCLVVLLFTGHPPQSTERPRRLLPLVPPSSRQILEPSSQERPTLTL